MHHFNLTKQEDGHARTLALLQFRAQFSHERDVIGLLNARWRMAGKDQLQRLLVFGFHIKMILFNSINCN